ncbi:MAG: hypothetical protein K2M94_04605 [Paramuribaculum sp.]|nr:hypothetical protein [Paramuribaculum sp.]
MLLTLFIGACSSPTKSDEDYSRIVDRINQSDSISLQDYNEIISALEHMCLTLEDKAKCIIDSGYSTDSVRARLRFDPEYNQILKYSGKLDSIVLLQVNNPYADPKIKTNYHKAMAKFFRHWKRLGLS